MARNVNEICLDLKPVNLKPFGSVEGLSFSFHAIHFVGVEGLNISSHLNAAP